jgi:hypothetical protein
VPTVPTAQEIANKIVIPQAPSAPAIEVPTAQEIADAIELPEQKETSVSIEDYKKDLSLTLSEDEIETKDFKNDLVTAINNRIRPFDDIERSDINSIDILESEVTGIRGVDDESSKVDLKIKVSFDDLGESEWHKFNVECDVTNMDRDEGYDDAEAVCNIDGWIDSSYL